MARRGSGYPASTIRTMVTAHMCHNAPDNAVTTYDDLERVERGAAHGRLLDVEGNIQRLQDTHGLFDDFGANAVTRQDCNVVSHTKTIL